MADLNPTIEVRIDMMLALTSLNMHAFALHSLERHWKGSSSTRSFQEEVRKWVGLLSNNQTSTSAPFTSLLNPTGNISNSDYDQRDLDRLDREDGYARCFLRTLKSKGDVDKAADVLHEAFLYRKDIGIWGK